MLIVSNIPMYEFLGFGGDDDAAETAAETTPEQPEQEKSGGFLPSMKSVKTFGLGALTGAAALDYAQYLRKKRQLEQDVKLVDKFKYQNNIG